jgi:hypothetical protein
VSNEQEEAREEEARKKVEEAVEGNASEITKNLSDLQTAVQDFADKYLSVTSLDTKRNAFEWVQAGSTLAVDMWTLWLRGALLVTGRAATITSDIVDKAGKEVGKAGQSGAGGGGFLFFGRPS